jgi:hypothetical protein
MRVSRTRPRRSVTARPRPARGRPGRGGVGRGNRFGAPKGNSRSHWRRSSSSPARWSPRHGDPRRGRAGVAGRDRRSRPAGAARCRHGLPGPSRHPRASTVFSTRDRHRGRSGWRRGVRPSCRPVRRRPAGGPGGPERFSATTGPIAVDMGYIKTVLIATYIGNTCAAASPPLAIGVTFLNNGPIAAWSDLSEFAPRRAIDCPLWSVPFWIMRGDRAGTRLGTGGPPAGAPTSGTNR